jgi:RHS repeat-associated protein
VLSARGPWPDALALAASSPARPHFVPIDSNGNLSTKVEGGVTWTYVWDAENRLRWVCNTTPCTQGAAVATYLYDPLGRRVDKVAGAATTTYTYDGEDIVRQIAGGSTLKFVHGPAIDEPLAQEDGAGALSYHHVDGLGSIVKMTNSAGAVTSTRRYDAFGNFDLGATNGYAFTGREWDAETGLSYYRARYYDPRIGRFLSEDPLLAESWPNLYAYVGNDPGNWTDPTGEAQHGPRNISVTHKGQTLTKLTSLKEIKRCLKEAIEEGMSREHITHLRALKKVVGRGGAMVLASPYVIDTTISEIDRARRCGGLSCLQKQLCDDLAEEGNPDFILSPAGLVPNPCKCSPFNLAACGT